MSKRIGLLDVDSKIPNLALMKVSAWHKARGDSVGWYMPLFDDFDEVYASKIFKFSSDELIDYERMIVGGTGSKNPQDLPAEIESMTPDYSIYNYPHNIGFAMRGCRLRCSFCVVPEKEGKPKFNSAISELWTQRDSDFLMLLDNDFFGNPSWSSCVDEILAFNLRVNFSQGINIRNLKPEQAQALASVRFSNSSGTKKQLHFAWDDPRHEKLIHKGIDTCMKAGIRPDQMAFYVLIGYHSTPDEDLHRVETLRDYGCDPYVMPYNKADAYQHEFARWVNHKAIFKTTSWRDYGGTKMKGVRKLIPTVDLFKVSDESE